MKKSFKSIVSLLLCLIMLSTTVLTSCDSVGSGNGDNASTTVTTKPSESKGPENTTIFASGVTLDKTTLSLIKGESETLIATIAPDNTTDKTLTWSTSDVNIATVENGTVIAVGAGTATITVTTANGKTATCEVTVTVLASGVTLNKGTLSLLKGENETLIATIDPDDTTDKTLSWASSNENVATVTNGKITAVGAGTATITVTTANGKTATCEVTVTVLASGVTLNKGTLTLLKGESETLIATVAPDDTTDKTLTWSTSDANVATAENGKITAVGAGTATITVTTANGKTATCEVTVTVLASGVTLNKGTLALLKGESETLIATVAPNDTTDKTLTWASSNESVVTVENGKVTAVGAGTATITVTTANGKTSTCEVTVTVLASGITLDKTSVQLLESESAALIATVTPSDATNTTVLWTTSDSTIATVSNGVVTAIRSGTATITATDSEGHTATCEVTVIAIGISFKTLSVDGYTAYGKFSNATTTFSFINEISATRGAKFEVYSDYECTNIIKNKIPTLKSGDNIFYVLEYVDDDVVGLYTVTIRRRPMYTVSFDTVGGTAIESQTIEEDSLAQTPNTTTKEGYTFISWDYDFNTPITSDTVITASWSSNPYTVTYDANGGTVANPTTNVASGEQYTLETPSRTGYTFAGWYYDETPFAISGEWSISENITLIAEWTANTNTSYRIEYYQQNLENDYYTRIDTVNKTGTTDTTANAEIKTYAHFTYNADLSYISGNIDGNGNLVLKVYYTRDTYTVTFDGNGGTLVSGNTTQTIKYGGSAVAPIFEKLGYTFSGWDMTFSSVDCSMTITGLWTAKGDTAYRIEYYLQNLLDDNYSLKETINKTGKTDTLAIAEIKNYEHFTPVASNISGNIESDGSLVLKVYYTRNVYTITFEINKGVLVSGEVTQSVKYEGNGSVPAFIRDGYTFVGWDNNEYMNVSGNATITAQWKPNTDTAYKVEYYLQNVMDDNYTLADSKNCNGTTDTTANAEIKNFDHFTYYPGISTISGNIDGSGNLVLKVYYTRDQYSITFVGNGGTLVSGSAIQSVKYGGDAIEPVFEKLGYTFVGWDKSFEAVDSPTVITAQWSANTNTTYKIEYYLQNLENASYTLSTSIYKTGTTDTTANAEIKEFEHFSYNESVSISSGVIAADGSLVLKVYYTRDKYTVTFDGNGGTFVSGNTTQTIKYGGNAVAPKFEKAGYTLSWDRSFTNVSGNITVTAIWTANTNTKYKVEYYQQNLENDYYTLINTVNKTGTTDTTANAEIKTYAHFTYNADMSVISGNIDGNGTLVLKVYYTRDKYTVIFDGNGGTLVNGNASQTIKYGGNAAAPKFEIAGYTLSWDRSFTNVSGNITVTAIWTANTNTKYKVEYYQQNLENDYYTLIDTVNKTGTTDTTANAEIKTYAHFTYNADMSVISGNLDGNGTLVLKVYYTRDQYTVTFDGNGGTLVSGNTTQTIKYGGDAVAPTFKQTGYTMSWNRNYTKVDDNITVTAIWSANTNTPYQVEHYIEKLDGTYELKDIDKKTGTSDSTITPSIKTYTGFTAPSTQTTTVLPDGSQVVKYYYTRNSYTVTFVTNGGDPIPTQSMKFEEALPDAIRSGFTFKGWFSNVNLSTSITTVSAKAITVYAYWLEENKPSDFTYSGTESISITAYNGTETTVVVPSYIGGISVTTIGTYAFNNCTSLTSITIPNSVTSIGNYAFYGCTSLTNITLPFVGATKDDTKYGYFPYIFGANGNDIGAWSGYVPESLKTVVITGGTIIRSSAFYGCRYLTSISLPDSLTSIGGAAFQYCDALTSITIPYGVTSISSMAFKGCEDLTSITIPTSVTSIDYYAFENCTSLTSITIGNSVTSIGDYAFNGCTSLTSVTIGNSVTSIGTSCFAYCTSLTSITIPDSVTSIGGAAFKSCTSLTSITIPNSVTSIFNSAFIDCTSLTSITIPNSVTSIGDHTFRRCTSLTSVTIPNSVTSIGNYAFENCTSLTSITIPDSVTSIGERAFENCTSLTRITIPNSVTSIGARAFYECTSLTSITIPDSVTSIGERAFENCTSLTSITIPDSVTSIGRYAFANCSNLTGITFEDTSTWYRTSSKTDWEQKTGGISTSMITDSTNANYFMLTYYSYYWYKL